MAETGVGAIICAAHKSRDGVLHGHTYEVVAWFSGGDALELQERLKAVCARYDHSLLGEADAWGERLGAAIRDALPGCHEVEVRRPLERIYARVRA